MLNLAANPGHFNIPHKGGMGQTLDMQPRLSAASFMRPQGFSIGEEKDQPWLNTVLNN